ncbi:MAG: hypothetical protein ACMUIA_12675 [bacterium]
MKKLWIFLLTLFLVVLANQAQAWNLKAMHINALRFEKDGEIHFTLFETGTGGNEFLCQGTSPWFVIKGCSSNNNDCISSLNRMGSMLLGAKLSGKPVHIQRSGCEVTEVALKP